MLGVMEEIPLLDHLSPYLEAVAAVLARDLEAVISVVNLEVQGRLLVKMQFLESQGLEVLVW
ncbi:hypothetical protein DRC29_21430 [Salmonella enterica]|nr:hypothetical protein [Salmonella enterica]EGX5006018.1 hypothetical protein [Salmonella enterica]